MLAFGVPREKPLRAEWRTNKLYPHITTGQGIKPGPPRRKAIALTIVPSLLSSYSSQMLNLSMFCSQTEIITIIVFLLRN